MSFVHIKDPQKRDEIVANYLTSLVKMKSGNIQEHTKDLIPQEDDKKEKNEQDAVTQKEINIPNQHKIVKHFGNLELREDGKHQMEDVLKFHIGNGIQFLPGDINGLQIKLDYLLAEYRAGNTSATRNQIVAIADELLRRKQLSRTKYNSINNCIIQHLEE